MIEEQARDQIIHEKHRILIWPSSDGSDAPTNLPVASDCGCSRETETDIHDSNVNATSTTATGPSPGTSYVAIIGWLDETTSCVTTIVIGSIASKSKKECNDVVHRLAQKFPCKSSNNNSQGCGNCYECTTYQTLQVLHIIPNHAEVAQENNEHRMKNANDSGNAAPSKKNTRDQIILYNPMEAQSWYLQQCHNFYTKNTFLVGTWQRNVLRMGHASSVWTNLSLTIMEKNDIPILNEPGDNKLADKYDDDATSNTDQRETEEDCLTPSMDSSAQKSNSHYFFDGLLNQSLFWLHLNSCWKNRQHCKADDKILFYGLFRIIPLFSVIQDLLSNKKASRTRTVHGTRNNYFHKHYLSSEQFPTNLTSSQFIGHVLDAFLGMIIGYILLSHPLSIVQYLTQLWKNFHDNHWDEGLRWLESFPAGFKLNVALTHRMGQEVRLAILYHRKVLVSIINTFATPQATFVQCIGLVTLVFGSRFFYALAFDITRLVLLHIHLLSSLFAACQRFELSTLTSLWLLFRGKKRNVLRRRSDHLKYDHMQLLLGMILFTIFLFLFTTILVYHCFFTIVNYVAELCVCGFWWYGFMVVEAVMQYDAVVRKKKQRSQDESMEKSWIGKEMQFHPAKSLPDDFVGNTMLSTFFREGFPSMEYVDNKSLFPHVLINTSMVSITKAAFPTRPGLSIAMSTLWGFALSKLGRIVAIVQKLLFGTCCPVASSLVDTSRSVRV